MSATYCYTLSTAELQSETVIALLGDIPFSGFEIDEANDSWIKAYIPEPLHSFVIEAKVKQLAERFGLRLSTEVLPDINWNQRWEESYAPVEIDKSLRIRASFHEPDPSFEQELEIIPEMSFGTGHHETTYLMARYLLTYPPFGKTCFDFGTGTGVLAMLAKRLGSTHTVATDIDERCVASTIANAARNGILLEEVRLGSEKSFPVGEFDLVLANINRSVLVSSMQMLSQKLTTNGQLWLSGILASDAEVIAETTDLAGLALVETQQRGQWLAQRYELKTDT